MRPPDFGSEPTGQPSETRQMVERGRTESGANISGRAFAIGLAVVALAIALLALLLR